jgi:hypothetical protein
MRVPFLAAHSYGESLARRSSRGSIRTSVCRPAVPIASPSRREARSAWALAPCQVLERNRQRSIAREFAEQIAVQIIHVRANEHSNPSPVAPDAAVSNLRNDLRRVRIENDVMRKDEILSHGFSLQDAEKDLAVVTIAPPRQKPAPDLKVPAS